MAEPVLPVIVGDAVEALLASAPVQCREVRGVWLFGSWARDAAGLDSDVDLAILCEPGLGLERATVGDSVGRVVQRDVDIVDLATAPPALVWEILTTGRLLRELDSERVETFVRLARFRAEDAAQRDRMVLLAQTGNVGGRER